MYGRLLTRPRFGNPNPRPGLFRNTHYGNSLNPFAPTKQEIHLNKQGLMPKTFTIVYSSGQ